MTRFMIPRVAHCSDGCHLKSWTRRKTVPAISADFISLPEKIRVDMLFINIIENKADVILKRDGICLIEQRRG